MATATITDVRTVNGVVPSSALGATLMHEHIFIMSPEVVTAYPATWGSNAERVDEAVSLLEHLKSRGVDTVVDLTVEGLGRNVKLIQQVAARAPVNIIVATGMYIRQALPIYHEVQSAGRGAHMLTDLFVREIEEGIGDTGVRAGVIKVTTDSAGVTPGIELTLRAAARAHRRTGTPISTHTREIPNGRDQQLLFREEGVDLSRVVIGHVDRAASMDLEYVRELLRAGSYVGFDRFGFPEVVPTEKRIECVAQLCSEGFAGQMIISHDNQCFSQLHQPFDRQPGTPWPAKRPEEHFTFIPDVVIPRLRELGVTEDDVERMMVYNPRAIFETRSLGTY